MRLNIKYIEEKWGGVLLKLADAEDTTVSDIIEQCGKKQSNKEPPIVQTS